MYWPGPGLSAAIISGRSDNQNQIRGGDIMMDPTNELGHLVKCHSPILRVMTALVSLETG